MRQLLIVMVAFLVTCCTDKKQEELMRRYLLEAKAQNENFQPFTTDSIMKEVVAYTDRHGSPNDRMTAHYDYGHYKEIALEKSEEARKAYIVTSTIIFLSVVVVIMFCIRIYIIKRNRGEVLQRQKTDYEYKIAMLKQIQSDMNILLAENKEKLKETIKERQDAIRKLEKEIDSYRTDSNLTEERLMNSDLTGYFQKLAKNAMVPSPTDWHKMREMIDDILPSFKTTFYNKKHVLRSEEYHVCILVRLHFKPLEISILTGLSQANVTVMRKRMLKKVFDKEGKPKDFDIFVSQIK